MKCHLDTSLLKSVPPFRQLSDAQIREILDAAQVRRHAPSVAIFDEGAAAERFFLLLDGHVRVVRGNAQGDQLIVMHIHPGQLMGIAAAIGRSEYPATAVATGECLSLSWPMALWGRFVSDYPGFATETYRVIGDRMSEMNARIMELATQAVEQRVASALHRLAEQSGKPVGEGILIDFPITRQNVSEMTGTTLHTVSRLLSAWEKRGIVQSARRRIVVTDQDALAALLPEAA